MAQAGLRPEQAAAKTVTDWARLFPDGRVAPGNELFAVEDESGERVGDPWIAEREDDGGAKVLYVYSIEIVPEQPGTWFRPQGDAAGRGRGRSRGIGATSLTVLGGNDVARSLYRSLGYAERAVFMSKDVGSG